uniref:Bm1071, isoform a n=1 Tax=Brugia malayi TaxID=6279 RepID=A0A1I9G6B5_BRUMA|nr:Bm1071, isoform a [Brugia malayi]
MILSSNNHFQTENIYHFLLQQPWAMVVLISSAVYIVVLPICGILFFCDSCSCATADSLSSSEALEITEESKTSKYLFALSLTMMTIVIAVILMLMIVYIESVSYAIIGSNEIDRSMDAIYADINLLTNTTFTDLTCKLNETFKKLSARINISIHRLPNKIFASLKQHCPIISLPQVIERFQIKNVTNFIGNITLAIKSTKSLANNLPKTLYQQSSMQNMIDTLEMISHLITLLQQYNDIYKAANNTRNNVEFYSDDIIKMISLTLKPSNSFINVTLRKNNLIIMKMGQIISNLHFIIQEGYHKINNVIKTPLKNPAFKAAIFSISIFAIVPVLLVIIPSIIVITCGIYMLIRKYRFAQQANWRCAGLWSLQTAGAAFFTGWITMLIASITFMGGFSVETICQPFFHDKQMHLYRSWYFNRAVTNLINFSKLTAGIGEFLYQCKNHKSILSALKMESFLQYYEQMHMKYLPNAAEHTKKLIERKFIRSSLYESQIREFNFHLLNGSFICRPFYDTLVNVGTIFCKQFSRPIHGIWSSAAIIAICFLAIIIIVLCISTFFFSLNNNFERRSQNRYDLNIRRGNERNFRNLQRENNFSDTETSSTITY